MTGNLGEKKARIIKKGFASGGLTCFYSQYCPIWKNGTSYQG